MIPRRLLPRFCCALADNSAAALDRPLALRVMRANRTRAIGTSNVTRVLELQHTPGSLAHVFTIGSQGSGPGQFLEATDIALGPNVELYVLDGLARELIQFNGLGVEVDRLNLEAEIGGSTGYLSRIAVSAAGVAAVLDADDAAVHLIALPTLPVAVEDPKPALPATSGPSLRARQAVSGGTRIEFLLEGIPGDFGMVELEIFDARGRRVAEVSANSHTGSSRSFWWRPADMAGHAIASGVYFARARVGSSTVSARVVVVR